MKSDGAVYFTDSVNGLRGRADGPARELSYNGVFRIKDEKVTLLDSDQNHPGEFPNGITFSPDEKSLYVTGGFGKTFRYDVKPDGTIANRKLFIEAGNDGMKTDRQGNLFAVNAVGPAEVWIVSPAGKHLGTLPRPQITGEPRPRTCASNVAFRRCRWQEPLHNCMHSLVSSPAKRAGHPSRAGSEHASTIDPLTERFIEWGFLACFQ